MTFVKLVSDDKSGLVLLQLKINDQTLVNLHSPNQDDPDLTRSQELISTGYVESGVQSSVRFTKL